MDIWHVEIWHVDVWHAPRSMHTGRAWIRDVPVCVPPAGRRLEPLALGHWRRGVRDVVGDAGGDRRSMARVVLPEETTTLLVEVHGPVPVQVSYATGGGPGDCAYVVVRSPATLVYALDAPAVAAVTHSLLLARARAGRILANESRPGRHELDRRVVGSVALRGDRRIGEPRALDADHSPNGSAHVVLRLDGLTLRLYDRAALDTYAKAWVEAHRAAMHAFGIGEVSSVQTLLRRAYQQARAPSRLDAVSVGVLRPPGAARVERSSEWRSL